MSGHIGDMLDMWTNGLYRSTPHRVCNPLGRERFSCAFFFDPNFDTLVETLPQRCSEERPSRYPPGVWGRHLLQRYEATHAGYAAKDAAEKKAPVAVAAAAVPGGEGHRVA